MQVPDAVRDPLEEAADHMFWKIMVLLEANSGHILHDHNKPAKVHHSLMESHDVWMPRQQLHDFGFFMKVSFRLAVIRGRHGNKVTGESVPGFRDGASATCSNPCNDFIIAE